MSGCCGLKICNTRLTIWLSAKRCVCNGWLGCAENKRCLIFCLFVCLECGLNVCENERGYSWNNSSRNFEAVWEICLINLVWFYCWNSATKNGQWHRARLCRRGLVNENKEKLYLSHLLCSRKIVLQDSPCIRKSISNFIWSDVICVAIRNANFRQRSICVAIRNANFRQRSIGSFEKI